MRIYDSMQAARKAMNAASRKDNDHDNMHYTLLGLIFTLMLAGASSHSFSWQISTGLTTFGRMCYLSQCATFYAAVKI